MDKHLSKITLNGAVAITGGASGIGLATARRCAALGARVAVLDLSYERAASTAAELGSLGSPAAIGLRCDVRLEDEVQGSVKTAEEALGPIRMLVTSAGIDKGGLVHELALERWREVLDVNLTGTFLACKHVIRRLVEREQSGSIVCLSSAFAQVSAPGGASAYCATKGGVSSLVRSMALDYAAHSIRVNAVMPGATETPLMWANVPADEIAGLRDRTSAQLALGRLADPAEIAAGIVWLLSDQSSYVTGSQLVVDGGLLARGAVDV